MSELPLKEGLPLFWVDIMTLSIRTSPDLALVRLYAVVHPDERVEVFRFQTTVAHLNKIADVICQNTGHTPKVRPVSGVQIDTAKRDSANAIEGA